MKLYEHRAFVYLEQADMELAEIKAARRRTGWFAVGTSTVGTSAVPFAALVHGGFGAITAVGYTLAAMAFGLYIDKWVDLLTARKAALAARRDYEYIKRISGHSQ